MTRKPTNCKGCYYYVVKVSKVYHGIVTGCARTDWDGVTANNSESVPCACFEPKSLLNKQEGNI